MTICKILLLNGPNLDMLGIREPEVYGRDTLGTLEHTVRMYAEQHDVELTCFQSNNEGKLIDKIHSALGKFECTVEVAVLSVGKGRIGLQGSAAKVVRGALLVGSTFCFGSTFRPIGVIGEDA